MALFLFLKIGSKPINVAYPLPITSFLVFSLFVDLSILGFVISYLFCFLFFTATNLWNHLNDAEDDLRDGRKEAKFLIEKRKEGVMFVVAFYILSLLVVIFSPRCNLLLSRFEGGFCLCNLLAYDVAILRQNVCREVHQKA